MRSQRHDELDPMAPQREAAMFYGLFLRGHSVESLRQEIDIPKNLMQRFLRNGKYEGALRESMRRSYEYRKQVLAIFDDLVSSEKTRMSVRLH